MNLSEKYKLLMVGAGQVYRIFNQMEKFPIDIIGNYGLQHDEVLYVGDDYGIGGNDESVYASDIPFFVH